MTAGMARLGVKGQGQLLPREVSVARRQRISLSSLYISLSIYTYTCIYIYIYIYIHVYDYMYVIFQAFRLLVADL